VVAPRGNKRKHCLPCGRLRLNQASFGVQVRRALRRALARTMSLRMGAVRASFAGLTWRSGRPFHDPPLRMRGRELSLSAALATVRVPSGTGGRGALLFHGLNRPGGCGLPSTNRLSGFASAGN
jgi:hypothetical protein